MFRVLVLVLSSHITVKAETCSPKLSLNQSFDYFNQCSFSANNFNPSCVSQTCSNFNGVCPYTPTGNAYVSTALSDCFQKPQASICGVAIAQVPICSFEVDLAGVSSFATGNCALTKGFTYGLNNATFCVTGNGPLTVSISALNITSAGTYECFFTVLGFTIPTPDLHVQSTLDIQATVTVDLSTQPPTVRPTLTHSDIDFQCTNFNKLLPQFISNTLTSGVGTFYKVSGNDQAAVNLLTSYVVAALQNTQQNCAQN